MAAPIVVDLGVPEPPRELASALLEACAEVAATAGTDCRFVRDAPSGPYTAIAIVTWEDGERARVEVGLRHEPTTEWRTRELVFQSVDVLLERYRSIGFVIGSLATAARDEPTPAPEKRAATASSPAEPATPPLEPAKATPVPAKERKEEPPPEPEAPVRTGFAKRGFIGVAAVVGGGLDRGPARYGGGLNVGVTLVPHWFALVSGSASTRARDSHGFSADWLDGHAGLGFDFSAVGMRWEARGQGGLEHFSARADSASGRTQTKTRLAPSMRIGFDAVAPLGELFALVGGVEGTLRPATRVRVTEVNAGATRNFELAAVLGLRLEL